MALLALMVLCAGALGMGLGNGASANASSATDARMPTRHFARAMASVATPADATDFGERAVPVDAAFATFYAAHAGADAFGPAITPAYRARQGWLQFFLYGALLLRSDSASDASGDAAESAATRTAGVDGLPDVALASATGDPSGTIRWLPLMDALVRGGSHAALADSPGAPTYADVRAEVHGDDAAPAPTLVPLVQVSPSPSSAIPVMPSSSVGADVGVMQPLVGLFAQASAPVAGTTADADGSAWRVRYGEPLTPAIPADIAEAGAHHLAAQAFARAAFVVDYDIPAADGSPTILRARTGLDYLRTFGPPDPVVAAGTPAWATGDLALRDQPGADAATHLTVGARFPLRLSGEATWAGGVPWYRAVATTPAGTTEGWVAATALSLRAPTDGGPAYAGIEALSPTLATFLAGHGDAVGVDVYDVTRGLEYGYNPDGRFTMASSMKVLILAATLLRADEAGRAPTGNELALLTPMIENSDNDAAQALYDAGGFASGIRHLLERAGLGGMDPDDGAWGYQEGSPRLMAHLLDQIRTGKLLSPAQTQLALQLLGSVEPDQRMGLGETLPPGASVAMKDGWVPGPDGLWANNTSGIVTVGGETYIVSVYTAHNASYDDGWDITRTVTAEVGRALTAGR